MPAERNKTLARTLFYGVLSTGLYFLLYLFNAELQQYAKQGGWSFVVPIGVAFLFSIVHGNFTGQFWDLFGIRAKTTKK